MSARVCGASAERDRLSASQCWCHGLFCYRGGHHQGLEFRHDTRNYARILSEREFHERLGQECLFDGAAVREKWLTRLEAHAPARTRKGA